MTAALITGGARRLGREIALYLAAKGIPIALHYHTSEAEAQTTAKAVRAKGVRCELFQADLNVLEALPSFMEVVLAVFPQCAYLVNNAAVFDRGWLMESEPELYENIFAINFAAPVFLTQAFVRKASAPQAVVNMLDARLDATRHSHSLYLLSKKALRDFTLMSAEELRSKNVRVNGVCPGKALPTEGAQADTLPVITEPRAVAEATWRSLTDASRTGQLEWV